MNQNQQLIETFYSAFANGDAVGMRSCYHNDIVFQDPAFGVLKGKDACDMWEMLIERSKGNLTIAFFDILASKERGSARWVATYVFTRTGRKVINEIDAQFEIRDGLIVRHTDYFDIWKWSKQAMGITGFLLGWTGFFQNKIQKTALSSLRNYQQRKS